MKYIIKDKLSNLEVLTRAEHEQKHMQKNYDWIQPPKELTKKVAKPKQ